MASHHPGSLAAMRQQLNLTSQATNVFDESSDDDDSPLLDNDNTLPATAAATKPNRSCCCCCTMPSFLSKLPSAITSPFTNRKSDNEESTTFKKATTTDIQVPDTPFHKRHRAIDRPGRSGQALVLDGLVDTPNDKETNNGDDGVENLERSNDARSRLRKEHLLVEDLEHIRETLNKIREIEHGKGLEGAKAMGVDIIRESHFDQMVEDILGAADKLGVLVGEDEHAKNDAVYWHEMLGLDADTTKKALAVDTKKLVDGILSTAAELENSWREKHGAQWLEMDAKRKEEIQQGVMRDIHLSVTPGHRGDQQELWKVDNVRNIAGVGGSSCFNPGDFWPLIFCAYRDGMVKSVEEVVTRGDWGPTALPMLTGTETLDESNQNISKFVHGGSEWNLHSALMATKKEVIRVIRGHELKSPLAPSKGLRYDGLYTVKSWGIDRSEGDYDYEVTIRLERHPGQTPMEEIKHIPTPAQQDIWKLCQEMIAAKKRASRASWSKQAGPFSIDFGCAVDTSTHGSLTPSSATGFTKVDR